MELAAGRPDACDVKNGPHPWPTSPVADLAPGIGGPRLTPTLTRGAASRTARGPDPDSQAWVDRLGSLNPDFRAAMRDLHALLLNAVRFEVDRRRWAVSDLRGRDREEFVGQLADSALAGVLKNLGRYDGESRFTTWACKFAILEAAKKDALSFLERTPAPTRPEPLARPRLRSMQSSRSTSARC